MHVQVQGIQIVINGKTVTPPGVDTASSRSIAVMPRACLYTFVGTVVSNCNGTHVIEDYSLRCLSLAMHFIRQTNSIQLDNLIFKIYLPR